MTWIGNVVYCGWPSHPSPFDRAQGLIIGLGHTSIFDPIFLALHFLYTYNILFYEIVNDLFCINSCFFWLTNGTRRRSWLVRAQKLKDKVAFEFEARPSDSGGYSLKFYEEEPMIYFICCKKALNFFGILTRYL